MKLHTIKCLISFANKLDAIGMRKEATRIDIIAEDIASSAKSLDPRFVNIFNRVVRLLEESNVNPDIIENVRKLQRQEYTVPAYEMYSPPGAHAYFIPQDAINVAKSYAQFYQSVEDIEDEMRRAETEEEYNKLRNELEYESRDLKDRWAKLMEYKKTNQPVFEKMREYIEFVLNKEGATEVRLFPERRKEDRRANKGIK